MLDGEGRCTEGALLERGHLWCDVSGRGNCTVKIDQEMSEYGIWNDTASVWWKSERLLSLSDFLLEEHPAFLGPSALQN